MARRGTVSSQATLVVGLFVRIYTLIKVLIGGVPHRGGLYAAGSLWLKSA